MGKSVHLSLFYYLIFIYKVTHEHCLAIPSKPGTEEYVASTLSNKRQTKSTEEAWQDWNKKMPEPDPQGGRPGSQERPEEEETPEGLPDQ